MLKGSNVLLALANLPVIGQVLSCASLCEVRAMLGIIIQGVALPRGRRSAQLGNR